MDWRINNSRPTIHGFGSKKFSGEKYKFYDLYWGMVARCNRKTNTSYKNYWARGIKCLWGSFEEFKNDMYESYVDHVQKYWRKQTSLDRIDVNWNYCKENCRWATKSEQANNTRKSLSVIVDWITYSTRDIANICWIWTDAAGDRIKSFNKWSITKDQLLLKWKIKKDTWRWPKKIIVDWVEYTSRKIADLCWISIWTASQRVNRYLEWISWKESLLFIWKQSCENTKSLEQN